MIMTFFMLPYPCRYAWRPDVTRRQKLDENFAGGYAGLSFMLSFQCTWGHVSDQAIRDRALALAERAREVDDRFGWSHVSHGMALIPAHRLDEAVTSIRAGIQRASEILEA